MEQEVVCSASNLIQHYEATLGLVLGPGLTDADKYAHVLCRMPHLLQACCFVAGTTSNAETPFCCCSLNHMLSAAHDFSLLPWLSDTLISLRILQCM